MKAVTVQVGAIRISVNGEMFSMVLDNYQGSISCQMSDDIKQALIAFTSLLIESEE